MQASACKLASIGAEFLISPCNVIHCAFEILERTSPLPWINMIEEVALEAKRIDCKRIALLGTTALARSGVYQRHFDVVEIQYSFPSDEQQAHINRFISLEMVNGMFTAEAHSYISSVMFQMSSNGCDVIGLCCTELSLIMPHTEKHLTLLDSTNVLAMAALERSLATCK